MSAPFSPYLAFVASSGLSNSTNACRTPGRFIRAILFTFPCSEQICKFTVNDNRAKATNFFQSLHSDRVGDVGNGQNDDLVGVFPLESSSLDLFRGGIVNKHWMISNHNLIILRISDASAGFVHSHEFRQSLNKEV